MLKEVYNNSTNTTTSTVYVRDASGNVMSTYVHTTVGTNSADVVWNEAHLYGSKRLGVIEIDETINDILVPQNVPFYTNTGELFVGQKRYELSNHLGNVLAVVNDRKTEDITNGSINFFTPTIISANDYYPFGLQVDGRNHTFNGANEHRYGFNGKEKDTDGEWGSNTHYDYGFRIYNPAIAKFLSVDPLTKSYPFYTPYQFAGNIPIRYIDLDGLEQTDHQLNWDPDTDLRAALYEVSEQGMFILSEVGSYFDFLYAKVKIGLYGETNPNVTTSTSIEVGVNAKEFFSKYSVDPETGLVTFYENPLPIAVKPNIVEWVAPLKLEYKSAGFKISGETGLKGTVEVESVSISEDGLILNNEVVNVKAYGTVKVGRSFWEVFSINGFGSIESNEDKTTAKTGVSVEAKADNVQLSIEFGVKNEVQN